MSLASEFVETFELGVCIYINNVKIKSIAIRCGALRYTMLHSNQPRHTFLLQHCFRGKLFIFFSNILRQLELKDFINYVL